MEGRAIANKEDIAFITLTRSHVTSEKLAKGENDDKGGGGGRTCPHKTVSVLLRAPGILKLGLQEILASKQRIQARPSQDFWIYFKNY